MELSEKQLNEINRLMVDKFGEKDRLSENYYNLSNGVYVATNNANYGYAATWKTYAGKRFQVLSESKTRIISDDRTSINYDCCRICKSIITPYKNIYFRRINEAYGSYWFKAYGYNNNYCEECAKAEGDKENKPPKAPKLLRDYNQHLAGDRYPTRIMEFEGFTIQGNDAWKAKK